jgi:hypothetical protein
MSLGKLVFGLASVAVGLTIPTFAYAQACMSDADCRKGTACQVSAVPPSPPTATCLKEGPCPEPAVAPVDAVLSTCQPVACQSDGDCGPDMACHPQTIATCTGTATRACPPNTVCDPPMPPPEPPTCTETTTSTCAYKWQLPCSADSDCGSGFTCMPSVTGSCSGGTGVGVVTGGGTAPPSGGTTPPDAVDPGAMPGATPVVDPAPTCTTMTSFPGYCQLNRTSCDTDSDCPASWMCLEVPVPVGRSTPVASDMSGGSTAPLVAPTPVATNNAKTCQPPVGIAVGGPDQGVAPRSSGVLTDHAGATSGALSPANPEDSGAHASGGAGCAIASGDVGAESGLGLAIGLGLGLLATALAGSRARKVRG